jgi:hypothetical protein
MRPVLFLLWLFIGCQPLRLPLDPDFQSIARGESGLTDFYFGIKEFHNANFGRDPFERITRSVIEQRLPPAPQQSETALEKWTVESSSHRVYDYTILVNVAREPHRATLVQYQIIAVNGKGQP